MNNLNIIKAKRTNQVEKILDLKSKTAIFKAESNDTRIWYQLFKRAKLDFPNIKLTNFKFSRIGRNNIIQVPVQIEKEKAKVLLNQGWSLRVLS